ncbi:hypothetical protein [ANMV-1 virus]|nr:hypothetical protein [ANMV-1 virus]
MAPNRDGFPIMINFLIGHIFFSTMSDEPFSIHYAGYGF